MSSRAESQLSRNNQPRLRAGPRDGQVAPPDPEPASLAETCGQVVTPVLRAWDSARLRRQPSRPLGANSAAVPRQVSVGSIPRRPGALGEPERRSLERQEQQPGPHLSPGPAEELKCPESDTAGRCISGSDLTIMDSVHQELPRAFRSFCSISDIHIKCGCQKQSLGEGAE